MRGQPCIHGMQIRVADVIDLYSSGLSASQILEEMPELEEDDLEACLQFASKRVVSLNNQANKQLKVRRTFLEKILPHAPPYTK